jgi:hypothetical protein
LKINGFQGFIIFKINCSYGIIRLGFEYFLRFVRTKEAENPCGIRLLRYEY